MSHRPRWSTASPAMGLAKRPALENCRSAVKPSGFGARTKNRVALVDISNASRRKNNEKPSSSSIGNLVIISPRFFIISLSFNGS